MSDLERRASASAAQGRTVADVDSELGELELQRSHKEIDREQLLRKQVGGRGSGGLVVEVRLLWVRGGRPCVGCV